MILFTGAALLDLAGIDNSTAFIWGIEQAERYLAFLDSVFDNLAADPSQGAIVEQHSEFRSYVAKFSKRRNSHGHRIFYREIEGGIRIIRILHTAMDWPEIL